jgi:protein phosphatase
VAAPAHNAYARASISAAQSALQQAQARGLPVEQLAQTWQAKATAVENYTYAYRHYCWPVNSLADLRLAPFHILATEGAVHANKTHAWHMAEIGRISAPPTLFRTDFRTVDLADAASCEATVAWWETMKAAGGEGMVVKPQHFISRGAKGLMQPTLKVRGKEYLRLIYGVEYDSAENLPRLRQRSVRRKRSLALREFALGIEALARFVQRAPLRETHRCVFGVLALESEPVDPRL